MNNCVKYQIHNYIKKGKKLKITLLQYLGPTKKWSLYIYSTWMDNYKEVALH